MTRILWVDDQPKTFRSYEKFLRSISNRIELRIVDSIEEGNEILENESIHGIVSDLNMDETSPGVSGADWIQKVSRQRKYLPAFISSGYLHDNRFSDAIKKSYTVYNHSKNTIIEKPFNQDPFLGKLALCSNRCADLENIHPERILFQDYLAAPDKYSEVVKTHWAKFGGWLNAHMKIQKLAWVVFAGDDVIAGSDNIDEFPDEDELTAMGKEHGAIPFAYAQTMCPEIVEWSSSKTSDTYYPKVKIEIDGQTLTDDFDTGAEASHFSDLIIQKGYLDFARQADTGVHTGYCYQYFTKKLDVGLYSSCGTLMSNKMTICVVQNWRKSSFTKISDTRQALIGRDILRKFDIQVILDSKHKKTYIKKDFKDGV